MFWRIIIFWIVVHQQNSEMWEVDIEGRRKMGAILKSQWLYQFGPQWEIFTNNALFILVSLKVISVFMANLKNLMMFVKTHCGWKNLHLCSKNAGTILQMAAEKCEWQQQCVNIVFVFLSKFILDENNEEIDGIFTKFFLNIDNNSIIHSS